MRLAFLTLLLSALNVAIADEPYQIENDPERFRVTFDDGVSIELVGVSGSDESLPVVWRANGSIMPRSKDWPRYYIYERREPKVENGRIAIPPRGEVFSFGFVYRFEGLTRPDSAAAVETEPPQSRKVMWMMPGSWDFPGRVIENPALNVSSTRVQERDLKDGVLFNRVGVTTIDWGPEVTFNPQGEMQPHDKVPDGFEEVYEQIKVKIVMRGRQKGMELQGIRGINTKVDFRVWATGVSGKKFEATSTTLPNEGPHQIALFELPEEAASYSYQLRPYMHWVTFKGLAIRPGQETKCEIVVEDLDSPK